MGLRSQTCCRPPTNFLAVECGANPLDILVHLQLLWMTSQRLSIQSVAPSATVWPEYKGGVLGIPIVGVWGVRGRELHQSKALSRLPHNTKFCSICGVWPEFQCKIMPLQFDPSLGVRVDLGGRNGTNRNIDPIFLFDFYTHTSGISCIVWPQYQRDRQT